MLGSISSSTTCMLTIIILYLDDAVVNLKPNVRITGVELKVEVLIHLEVNVISDVDFNTEQLGRVRYIVQQHSAAGNIKVTGIWMKEN